MAQNNAQSRSIAIVGAGLTGLGFLTALLDLPDRARPGWQIDCYERRDSVGGIWHPQKGPPPEPPQEPETPFYDGLECITLCNGSESRVLIRTQWAMSIADEDFQSPFRTDPFHSLRRSTQTA